MGRIINEFIRGTGQGEFFGEKDREARLRWFVCREGQQIYWTTYVEYGT